MICGRILHRMNVLLVVAILMRSSPVRAVDGGEEPLAAARTALAEARLEDAVQLAMRAVESTPTEREPLEILAAIHDARRNEKAARSVHERLKMLPPAVTDLAQPGEPMKSVKPGDWVYSQGTRLNLRPRPSSNTEARAFLPLNAPLKVLHVEPEWLKVGAVTETDQLGWVSRSYVGAEPVSLEESLRLAREAEAAGKPREAARHLEHAAELNPVHEATLKDLLRNAVAARWYPLAAETAVDLHHAHDEYVSASEQRESGLSC